MTKLVGILNLTPDSFFDGGKYNNIESSLKHTKQLIEAQIDIIDIGAESTRPLATPISFEEEWQRLKDILPKIINYAHSKDVQISLDSRYYQNIKKALDLGIDIINDVSGLKDLNIINLAKISGKKVILMHNLGVPADKNKIIDPNLDVIEEVIKWAENKINQLIGLGIKKEQIIFDPGVGFGKNAQQSIKIIKDINKFKILDLPILVGHSNKSFLDKFDDYGKISKEEKTSRISKYLSTNKIEYIRVHKYNIFSTN